MGVRDQAPGRVAWHSPSVSSSGETPELGAGRWREAAGGEMPEETRNVDPVTITEEEYEAMPEAVRGRFTAADDGTGYTLQERDTSGLSSSLQKERDRRRTLERELREAREARERLETDITAASGGSNGKTEGETPADVLRRHREQTDQERATAKADRAKLMERLASTERNARGLPALTAAGLDPELVRYHLERQARMIPVEGSDAFEVEVTDAHGKPLAVGDQDPFSVLAESLRQQFPNAVANPPRGTGAGRNSTTIQGKSAPNPWKKDTWNITEQMTLERQDSDKAKRLASEAGVSL